jgi:hypothetical protein
MSTLKEKLISHLAAMDLQLDMQLSTGKTLLQWFEPLLTSITEDGAISYLIEVNERYRASPLASSIEWLDAAGLLPLDVLEIMQDKLLYLRDNNVEEDKHPANDRKFDEDRLGWSLGEGVSVWSTSMALLALLDRHGIWEKNKEAIKDSILWLIKQRDVHKKGWSYQLHDNCEVNVVMTSLALRALSKFQLLEADFSLSSEDERNILIAINNGVSYLQETHSVDKKKGFSYWQFGNVPNCTATTWALLALDNISRIAGIEPELISFYNSVKRNCIRFIVSCIPKDVSHWPDEQIVFEGGAKYNKQKNYQSFCVTLLPQLFSLGLSPYHPKVINQMHWVIRNPSEWKIANYDRRYICAFTHAMVVSGIVKWLVHIGKTNSAFILKEPDDKKSKIINRTFGFNSLNDSPVQLVLNRRIKTGILILVLLFLAFFFGKCTFAFVQRLIKKLVSLWSSSSHDITVNVIASFVYAALLAVSALILKKIRAFFRR